MMMRAIKPVCSGRGRQRRGAGRLVLVSMLLLFSFLTPVRGQEGRAIVELLRIKFPEADIKVEPITGALVVRAPLALQEKIGEMIEHLDVYHPQITIEAKFVELTVTDIKELGIDLDILNIRTGPTLEEGAVDIISAWDVGGMGTTFSLARLDDPGFHMVLRAMKEQGKVSVLSAPRVTTLSGHLATIAITETIPYVAGVETEEVEGQPLQIIFDMAYEEIGIFLDVTPEVLEGSTLITLHLEPTVIELVDQLDIFEGVGVPPGLGVPVIDERTTTTTMVIESGHTVVLGGLIRDHVREIERRTPLLGDIPFLGHLFRFQEIREERKNLLIFITAYLVSPEGERILARGGR